MVVWTALLPVIQKGLFLGPKKSRKIRHANAHSIGESHVMTTPSICCVFICTNLQQISILGRRNPQLPCAKKKLIELSFEILSRLAGACHPKQRWMSGCATPPNPGPRAPPSAICATPATQNRGCPIVPHLPREIKVDVRLCHACHAEVARCHGRHGRLNQDQARHPVPSVPPATQNDHGCAIVSRLPREIKVDVTGCHACEIILCLVCVCEVSVCVCEV